MCTYDGHCCSCSPRRARAKLARLARRARCEYLLMWHNRDCACGSRLQRSRRGWEGSPHGGGVGRRLQQPGDRLRRAGPLRRGHRQLHVVSEDPPQPRQRPHEPRPGLAAQGGLRTRVGRVRVASEKTQPHSSAAEHAAVERFSACGPADSLDHRAGVRRYDAVRPLRAAAQTPESRRGHSGMSREAGEAPRARLESTNSCRRASPCPNTTCIARS